MTGNLFATVLLELRPGETRAYVSSGQDAKSGEFVSVLWITDPRRPGGYFADIKREPDAPSCVEYCHARALLHASEFERREAKSPSQ